MPSAEEELRRLAGELERRADELANQLLERYREEVPEWSVQRPELLEPVASLARRSIAAELGVLRAGGRVPTRLGPPDVEFAREAARAGGVGELLDGYRRGHLVQWEAWFALVESEAEPTLRRVLLERGSGFFFAYAGAMHRLVMEEHDRERQRLRRSSDQRRTDLVRGLLEGEDLDLRALGYDLDDIHLGVVAWGAAPVDAVHGLAGIVDRRPLVVLPVDGVAWGWLGGRRPLADAQRRALDHASLPAATQLALGEDEAGIEGFRRTHAQAVSAHRAGLGGRTALTRFDDVALEALATRDEREARAFVGRELRGLQGPDERSRRLRETLRSYFRAGQNAAAAAAALGVHEQTIAQRLRAVEERTGRTVAGRRAELEVALRLATYLDPG